MARTELPWLLAGRRVRPFALAVSLATTTLAAIILSGQSVWGGPDAFAVTIAVFALASAALLWVGFWARSDGAMQHGLLLAASVFAARGAYIGVDAGWTATGWLTAALSWCWTVAAGGAYLLEATTGGDGGVR